MLCLAVMTTAWAESINENQARAIASQFMAGRSLPSTGLKMARKAPRMTAPTASSTASYYVFNAPTRGYVIVAGDDRAPAVLGYSDQGTFDSQDVPEALQDLLESYAAQIEALDQGATAAPRLITGSAIAPLVTATWSQNNPFNILLPYLPDGSHAHVGCVATAMAQVMYYWQWPARPTRPIPAYTSTYTSANQTLSFDMPELPVTDFNWPAMQDTYLTSDTASTAALAAATLSLYCAQSLEMNFKPSSSGAVSSHIPCRAATYFDYDPSAHMVSRSNYTAQGWAELLYTELAAGRPVIYSGRKASGGHSFICDGYDGNGLYHFNWGWNSSSNGYFLLNVLNPDQQGTGSASGTYGYILGQGAIVGFQPNKGGSHIFELTATDVTLNSYTGTRSYTNDPFMAVVSGNLHNYTSDTLDVRFGWGLFKDGEMVKRLASSYNHTLRPGVHQVYNNKELEFGENMTSGTYRIMPMFAEYGTDNWRPCAGADRNYIEVTITGNQCSFTGQGSLSTRNYTVNDITVSGTLHNGRTADISLTMTNNGTSRNDELYMFANGTLVSAGYLNLERGETADVPFKFMPTTAGNYTLTWSWNDNGSNPIYSHQLTITAMPAANLSASVQVLNVTDNEHMIVTGKAFSIELTVTNNGSSTYDEDISAKLYKNIYDNTGSGIQGLNQRVTLEPGETKTLRFDLDNVINGWRYFANTLYYSEGKAVSLARTSIYTIALPEPQEQHLGDMNGDGQVNVTDVILLINHLMDSNNPILEYNADMNQDGNINVTDAIQLITQLSQGQ